MVRRQTLSVSPPATIIIMRRSRFLLSLLLNATFQWMVASGAKRRKIECLAEAQFQLYCLEDKMTFSAQLDSLLSREFMHLRRILSSASYGGTFLQRKASSGVASRQFSHSRPITRRFAPPSPNREGLTCGGLQGKLFLHIEDPSSAPSGHLLPEEGLTCSGLRPHFNILSPTATPALLIANC